MGCGTLSNNNTTVIDYIWFIDEERLHSPEMSWYSPKCRTWCSENINLHDTAIFVQEAQRL
jgi:hypothetical protein